MLFLGLVLGLSSGWLNVQGVGFGAGAGVGVGVVASSFLAGWVGLVEASLLLLSPLSGCADVSSFLLGGIIIIIIIIITVIVVVVVVVIIVVVIIVVTALPMKVWVCRNGMLICCSLSPVGWL